MRFLPLVALVALVGPAAADTGIPEMHLRVVPTQAAPEIEATIINGPLLPIGARIANRYLVRFSEHLTWDGTPQYVTVDLGGKTLEPVALYGNMMPPAPEPARYNPFLSWWFQLAMGLGAVGVIDD